MFEEIRLSYENEYLHNDEESLMKETGEENNADLASQFVVRDNPNLIGQVWWWPIFIYMEIIKKPPSIVDKNSILKYQVRKLNFCFVPFFCQQVEK